MNSKDRDDQKQNEDDFILEPVELANGDKFKVLSTHCSDPRRDEVLRSELNLIFATLIAKRTEFSKLAGPEIRIEGRMWVIVAVKGNNKFHLEEAYTKQVDAQTSCLKRIATWYRAQYGKGLTNIKWNALHYLMFARLKEIITVSGIKHLHVNYGIQFYGGPVQPAINDEGNKVWENLMLIYRTLSDKNICIKEAPLKYTI